ncbi:MAG: hypothetical protein VX265_15750, partial [Myxococcota bacterium]|nr:hypothetical protein [Myxococcota bacterium]
MEKRKFGIPAIALGFTALTLTACPVDDDKDEDEDEEEDEDAAGIDGSWSLEAYSYEGTAYPLENTYEYYGYVYTTALGVTLTIAAPTVDAVLNTSYYTDNPANSDSNGDEST